MVKLESKKFWESKTFWINLLFILSGIASAIAGEMATGGALTLAAIINIVIRVYTNTEIKK